jgi:hypothetical protein
MQPNMIVPRPPLPVAEIRSLTILFGSNTDLLLATVSRLKKDVRPAEKERIVVKRTMNNN